MGKMGQIKFYELWFSVIIHFPLESIFTHTLTLLLPYTGFRGCPLTQQLSLRPNFLGEGLPSPPGYLLLQVSLWRMLCNLSVVAAGNCNGNLACRSTSQSATPQMERRPVAWLPAHHHHWHYAPTHHKKIINVWSYLFSFSRSTVRRNLFLHTALKSIYINRSSFEKNNEKILEVVKFP